jgi:cyclase
VSFNTAAVQRPEVLTECAERFGAQCVVASIDARTVPGEERWMVHTHGGKRPTPLDAVRWARECAERGAGEVLLTSIDRDGARSGYDLPLTRAVSEAVTVPVIASGGAGSAEHVVEALEMGGADAALVAGILHDGLTTVSAIKARLADRGIAVRRVA